MTVKFKPTLQPFAGRTRASNLVTVDSSQIIGSGFIAQEMVPGVNHAQGETSFSMPNVTLAWHQDRQNVHENGEKKTKVHRQHSYFNFCCLRNMIIRKLSK